MIFSRDYARELGRGTIPFWPNCLEVRFTDPHKSRKNTSPL